MSLAPASEKVLQINDLIASLASVELDLIEPSPTAGCTLKAFESFHTACIAEIMNMWSLQNRFNTYKSLTFQYGTNGEAVEDLDGIWFVVGAELPAGNMTFHFPINKWDMFNLTELFSAPDWDGHTYEDSMTRMRTVLPGQLVSNERA